MRASRLLAMLLPVAAAGCDAGGKPADKSGPPPMRRASMVRTEPLKPGAVLPPLEAAGWLNGDPPKPGAGVLVVDVWAVWCPFCEAIAPGLADLHKKYAPKGVGFVSLTNTEEDMAARYARKGGGLTWPIGHGVSELTVAELGAGSGMPGMYVYEIAPTLYVVGRDGRVKWADGRARQSAIKAEDWLAGVEAAIVAALAEADKPPTQEKTPEPAPKRE